MKFNVPTIDDSVEGAVMPSFKPLFSSTVDRDLHVVTLHTPPVEEVTSTYKVPTIIVPISSIRLSDSPVTTPVMLTPKIEFYGLNGSAIQYVYNYDFSDILWMGDWDSNLAYVKGSQVRYGNESEENIYVALQDIPQGVSPLNTNYWDLYLTGRSFAVESDIEDLRTLTTQTANAIKFLASKQEFNSLGEVVQGNIASLSVQGDKIDAKVDKVNFDDLGKIVDANTATLEVHAEKIASKVERSEFNQLGAEVENTKTQLIQTDDQIRLMATKTELDDVSGKVEATQSSLDVQSEKIATLVVKDDFDALGKLVSEHSTAIEETTNALKLTASQSDLDDVTGRLSTAESTLSIQSDSIDSKVSKDGIISEINQSPEEITIHASKINLNGALNISSFSDADKTTLNDAIDKASNAETPTGAQDKADAAVTAAKTYTDSSSKTVNDNLRTDLRLSGSLPSEVSMDSSGFTAFKSAEEYARLNGSGLLVVGGALDIRTGTESDKGVLFDINGIRGFDNSGHKTFELDVNGNMVASNVDLTGKITATSGSIAGFQFNTIQSGFNGTKVLIQPDAGVRVSGGGFLDVRGGEFYAPTTVPTTKDSGSLWIGDGVTAGIVKAGEISDLGDVTIQTPVDGDGLIYHNGAWVNSPVAEIADKNFEYTQNIPATVWTIDHNLNKMVNVTVLDSANTVVGGQVEYVNKNRIVVTFNAAFSGTATLN